MTATQTALDRAAEAMYRAFHGEAVADLAGGWEGDSQARRDHYRQAFAAGLETLIAPVPSRISDVMDQHQVSTGPYSGGDGRGVMLVNLICRVLGHKNFGWHDNSYGMGNRPNWVRYCSRCDAQEESRRLLNVTI